MLTASVSAASPAAPTLPSPAGALRFVHAGCEVLDALLFFPIGRSARERVRARLGFNGQAILTIGRPRRDSGHDRLIEAFGAVVQREPSAQLCLAIDAADASFDEREWLRFLRRRAAQSVFGRRIHFAPLPGQSERPDWCRAADLFVSTTPDASEHRFALEAMACGAPAVLPDGADLGDSVAFGRHALTADPQDPVDLGLTMAKVFRHPRLRARLTRMSRHYARSFLAWTGIADVLATEGGDQHPATSLGAATA